MVEVQLLDRLRVLAARKRWTIGLAVGGGCRRLDVALVGTEGHGLSSRPEVFAHRWVETSVEIRRLSARLRRTSTVRPTEVGLLAAQLAESQAALLDEFAAQIAPVWDRVLAVAVDGPGLWARSAGVTTVVGLCDAARLAELCGLNVIDGFAGRDLARDGRGRPLVPIPYWLLLHDLQRTRVLVEWRRRVRLTYLPASRDAAGAARVLSLTLSKPAAAADVLSSRIEAVRQAIATRLPSAPRIDELVIYRTRPAAALLGTLAAGLAQLQVLEATRFGIPPGGLRAAGVALLGVLNLDQVPAATTAITGTRAPRVLGRLTPGSLANWYRLVRELASARPSVVSLRSAV